MCDKRQFYQIANRKIDSSAWIESNRIELFFPESESSNKNYKKHNFIRDVARAGGGILFSAGGGRIRLRHWAQGRT